MEEHFRAMDDDEVDIFVMDFDYEFDADCFFDFTKPESTYEAAVVESWFRTQGSYPPSPFAVESKWREEDPYNENENAIAFESPASIIKDLDDVDPITPELNGNGEETKCRHESSLSAPTTKAKSAGKSSRIRDSTLMKPTASQLAKLKSANEIYPCRSIRRSPTSQTGSSETSLKSSPLSVHLDATKRQKLDIGYLRKVARLKHHNPLLHKLSKGPRIVANNVNPRPKPTLPKKPVLETTQRAQRQRSRHNPETSVNPKVEPSPSKARLVNRKISKTYPLPPENKCYQRSPLSQRNIQVSSKFVNRITGIERLTYEDASNREKNIPPSRTKLCSLAKQKLKHLAENGSTCNPPTELFKKMSLKSGVESNANCSLKKQLNNKVRKENMHASFRQEIWVS